MNPDEFEKVICTVVVVIEMLDVKKQYKETDCYFCLDDGYIQDINIHKKRDKSRKPDVIRLLRFILAATSFFCGIIIAFAGIFFITPLGEISNSSMSVVTELLILCGTILGVEDSNKDRRKKQNK